MLNEIIIFIAVFVGLMLKMENKGEWLYNIKQNKLNNWRKKWHKIPTTKLALALFIVLFLSAVASSLFPFHLNYLVWDFFFILHFTLFILAGASLYLFLFALGGRAVRIGSRTGKLSNVEGTEPSGEKEVKGETFADGMFRSFFDVTLGESKRKKKRKKR